MRRKEYDNARANKTPNNGIFNKMKYLIERPPIDRFH